MKRLIVSGMIAAIASAPSLSMEHENNKDMSNETQERQEVESAKTDFSSNQQSELVQSLSKDEAKKVQEKLADKGLYEGSIDGKIGPMTSSGIEKFQKDNQLNASGELNQETLEALGVDASLMQAQEEDSSAIEPNRNTDSSVDSNSDSSATRQGDYQYDDTVQRQETGHEGHGHAKGEHNYDVERSNDIQEQNEALEQDEIQRQEDVDSREWEGENPGVNPGVNESSRIDDSVEAEESDF